MKFIDQFEALPFSKLHAKLCLQIVAWWTYVEVNYRQVLNDTCAPGCILEMFSNFMAFLFIEISPSL